MLRDVCADLDGETRGQTLGVEQLKRLFDLVDRFTPSLVEAAWSNPEIAAHYGAVLKTVSGICANLIDPDIPRRELRPTQSIEEVRTGQSFALAASIEPRAASESLPPRAMPWQTRDQRALIAQRAPALLDRGLAAIEHVEQTRVLAPFMRSIQDLAGSWLSDGTKLLFPQGRDLSVEELKQRDALIELMLRLTERGGDSDRDLEVASRLATSLNYAVNGARAELLETPLACARQRFARQNPPNGDTARALLSNVRNRLVGLDRSYPEAGWSEIEAFIRADLELADQLFAAALADPMAPADPSGDETGTLSPEHTSYADICAAALARAKDAKEDAEGVRQAAPALNRLSAAGKADLARREILPPASAGQYEAVASRWAATADRIRAGFDERWSKLGEALLSAEPFELSLGLIQSLANIDAAIPEADPPVWGCIRHLAERHRFDRAEFALSPESHGFAAVIYNAILSPGISAPEMAQLVDLIAAHLPFAAQLAPRFEWIVGWIGGDVAPEVRTKCTELRALLLRGEHVGEAGLDAPSGHLLKALWKLACRWGECGTVALELLDRADDGIDAAQVQLQRLKLRGIAAVAGDMDPAALERLRESLQRRPGFWDRRDVVSAELALAHDRDLATAALAVVRAELAAGGSISPWREYLRRSGIAPEALRLLIDGIAQALASSARGGPDERRDAIEELMSVYRDTHAPNVAALAAALLVEVRTDRADGKSLSLHPLADNRRPSGACPPSWHLPPPCTGTWADSGGEEILPELLAHLPVSPVESRSEASDDESGPASLAVRWLALECFAEGVLVEVGLVYRGEMIASLLFLKIKGEFVHLNGFSWPIYGVNERFGTDLATQEAALAYLGLFCGVVAGDDGPFTILSEETFAEQHLLDGEDTDWLDHLPPVTIEARNGGNWDISAPILYGRAPFLAHFELQKSGMIDMLSDRAISGERPGIEILFHQGWRVGRPRAAVARPAKA
jgi:hypothetical protein